MSPALIMCLLEVHCFPMLADCPRVRHSLDHGKGTLDELEAASLIYRRSECPPDEVPYHSTDRAVVYLEHIGAQPLPEKQWVMPT